MCFSPSGPQSIRGSQENQNNIEAGWKQYRSSGKRAAASTGKLCSSFFNFSFSVQEYIYMTQNSKGTMEYTWKSFPSILLLATRSSPQRQLVLSVLICPFRDVLCIYRQIHRDLLFLTRK